MPSKSSLVLSGLAGLLAACSGIVSVGGDGQDLPDGGNDLPDGGNSRDAAHDGGPGGHDSGSGSDGGAAPDTAVTEEGLRPNFAIVLCPWGLPEAGRPAPDAATETYRIECEASSDCTIVRHLHNCCGQIHALGARVEERLRFDADGGVCHNEVATCGCAAGGALTDDGETSQFGDLRDVVVECTPQAVCRTHVTTFACGNDSCDARSEYCEAHPPGIAFADGGTPPTAYICGSIPAACANTPTCACITAGMGAAVEHCTEHSGKVTVTYFGV